MLLRRGRDGDRLGRIEVRLQRMLRDDAHAYGLAVRALLGEVPAADVVDDVRRTDLRVNEGQREIRRELVLHASVLGGIDIPAAFVYMSIVKDVERIGDYAKNLVDVAADGGPLLDEGGDGQALLVRVGELLDHAAATFGDRDVVRAEKLLTEADELQAAFDTSVSNLVSGTEQGPDAVAKALTYRYLKRIVAHLMNLLSSVVLPVDRLDHFDEDPEDRR
jgi:phosphate uptake regulator